jgi:hypothetical protein
MGSYVREERKLLARDISPAGLPPYLIVAALHQTAFKLYWIAYEWVVFHALSIIAALCYNECLQESMEASVVALAELQQQVETSDLGAILRGMPLEVCGVVEGLELRVVADEGLRVARADGEERAGFENRACSCEGLGRYLGGRY